jgi:hypothetical protein
MRMATGNAQVTLGTRPLWRIRIAREWSRYLLSALACAGLAASARFAIDPPRPATPRVAPRGPAPPDLAAEGYASLFARDYLTWNAADPQAHESDLASFAGPGIDPDAGLQPPASGEQRVEWAEVVQARELRPTQHVYTVAAQTDDAGLLYLTVPVVRTASGSLALGGYPAFVGAPATGPAQAQAQTQGQGHEVKEPALATVVGRALRNYLSASGSELAADLTDDARVSLPTAPLSLESVQRLDWAPGAGPSMSAVLAVVQANDARGARYTLAYELDVARVQGRWEVSAIQMDPDS